MSKPLQLHAGDGKIAMNELGHVLLAYGTTVPSDGVDGYAKGCIFIDTNGAAENIILINAGSITSADFNALGSAGVAPAAAPTAVDATVIDATYGAPEQAVIDSIRVTLNEVVAAVKAHGIMA
jgi:hypothetical protein